jgi:hypothetical protein
MAAAVIPAAWRRSGTDGAILICNPAPGKTVLCGKHSKLGELIGVTVKAAVKEALGLETGLTPRSQFNVLKRFRRFGLTADHLLQNHAEKYGASIGRPEFMRKLELLAEKEELVIPATLYVHLMDQMDWGLLTPAQAIREGKNILNRLKERYGVETEIPLACGAPETAIAAMTDAFAALTARIVESPAAAGGVSG